VLIDGAKSLTQIGSQRYRNLLTDLPICIILVDVSVIPAVILEANRLTELVYGYSAAELAGCLAAHLVAEESRECASQILQRVQHGETVTDEINSRHQDGTTFPVRVIATLDEANNSQAIFAVVDITSERQRRNESEAINRERLRIAHEFHDGIAQDLAGLRLKSALWHQFADTDPSRMHAALDELQRRLNIAISDLRRAIFALRPIAVEELGFFPALDQLVHGFEQDNRLATHLEITGAKENLPAAFELPLFRIIQEGLNNVNQHACASQAFVQLTVNARGGVIVSVRDNGRGIDPDRVGKSARSGRFGLRQMRERIQDLGGTLDICSAVEHWTELLITLPSVNKEVGHVID
jgi:PAS domain S-box-containing protein